MRLLAATLFALTLFALTANAEEPPQAEPPTFTVAELAGLFESGDVPVSITSQGDFNADDIYVAGLRVWGGSATVLVGDEPIASLVKVFVYKDEVVSVKVEQLSEDYLMAKDSQAQYEALREDAFAALAPDKEPQMSASVAYWVHAGQLNAQVGRGYEDQGMFFIATDKDGQAVVSEFWQKWNAAIEEMAAGFFFFGF